MGEGERRAARLRVPALVTAVVLAAALGAALGACDQGETPRPPPSEVPDRPALSDADPLLLLDFDDARVRAGRIVGAPAAGADVAVALVTAGAGQVRAVPDPTGGTAAGFPAAEDAEAGDLAAVAITPAGDTDTLSPGSRDFAFGLDVMLPEAAAGGGLDDGDNLMQRGLFGGAGQFKLQIDGGRPSCRVAGDDGEVLVKATGTVEVGEWYRLRCERIGDRVDLFVGRLDDAGEVTWQVWSEDGATGEIGAGTPPATLSVAAKLNANGTLVVDAPDQFSGTVDHMVLVVDQE